MSDEVDKELPNSLEVHEAHDDLLDWMFLFLGLECDQCGRFEFFDEAQGSSDFEGEHRFWEFAERAVKIARRDSWRLQYDSEFKPVCTCGQCVSASNLASKSG